MVTATDNGSGACLTVTRATSGKLEAKSRFEAKKSRDVPWGGCWSGSPRSLSGNARILEGLWDRRNVAREGGVKLEGWEVEVNSVDEEWTQWAWEIVRGSELPEFSLFWNNLISVKCHVYDHVEY